MFNDNQLLFEINLNSSVHTVVYLVVTSINVVSGYQFVRRTSCIPETEAVHASETSVLTYQITRCKNLEGDTYEFSSP